MPKPEGMSDDQWEEELERRATEKALEMSRERIKRVGFETYAYEIEPGDRCERAVTRKVKNRWAEIQCGEPGLVTLKFAAPSYPDGVEVTFCRRCLGEVVKDLVGYLQCD